MVRTRLDFSVKLDGVNLKMIFAIISAWLAYKKAKDTNRNAILWAIIAAATFIGTQLILQLGFGVLIGLGIAAFGWSESLLETYNIPITILAVVCSFGTTWLVLHYLDKPLKDESYQQPPAPPTFDGK